MRQIVIGLGNPLLGDDGIGPRVAEEVDRLLPDELRSTVHITEAAVGGLRLAELMTDYDRVILIDALLDVGPAGSIHEWDLEELDAASQPQRYACAHDTTLATALELHRSLGVPGPNEVHILAATIDEVDTFGCGLSGPLERAVPELARRALGLLSRVDTENDEVTI